MWVSSPSSIITVWPASGLPTDTSSVELRPTSVTGWLTSPRSSLWLGSPLGSELSTGSSSSRSPLPELLTSMNGPGPNSVPGLVSSSQVPSATEWTMNISSCEPSQSFSDSIISSFALHSGSSNAFGLPGTIPGATSGFASFNAAAISNILGSGSFTVGRSSHLGSTVATSLGFGPTLGSSGLTSTSIPALFRWRDRILRAIVFLGLFERWGQAGR